MRPHWQPARQLRVAAVGPQRQRPRCGLSCVLVGGVHRERALEFARCSLGLSRRSCGFQLLSATAVLRRRFCGSSQPAVLGAPYLATLVTLPGCHRAVFGASCSGFGAHVPVWACTVFSRDNFAWFSAWIMLAS